MVKKKVEQPSEELVRLAAELLEAWNAHDINRALTFYSPEYEGEDVAQALLQRGLAGVRQTTMTYLSAFPDLHFTCNEVIVEGKRVVVVWTAQATHHGKWMNIPATGRRVEFRGVASLLVEANQVRRGCYIWDTAGLLRAIGLLPELR